VVGEDLCAGGKHHGVLHDVVELAPWRQSFTKSCAV